MTGKTPAIFTLPQATWNVTVTSPGCTPYSVKKKLVEPFTLKATISYTLTCKNEPGTQPGIIRVDSNPQGAAIYLDGQYIGGETPGYIGTYDTSPLTHTVSVALENYKDPVPWTGSVGEGGTVEVSFDLTELQPPPQPVPEFPSIFAPLVSLIGISLVVILLKGRKSH